jgi:uncharacterized membrane protein
VAESGSRWPQRFADAVRFVVAPVILFAGGFSTTDFLLSGVYTWPRTSRVLVLTITVIVLSYEFVYKEQRALKPDPSGAFAARALLYSCAIPYALGVAALLALARM